ncbi:putative protein YeeZ-like [Capsicum annuum]|nr:putative protein YeeZ-like [Capsicum annuum]KAF3671475.1 putative protein YeeZ-like [Capsicum annuum]
MDKEAFATYDPAGPNEMIFMKNNATLRVEESEKIFPNVTSGKVLTLNNVLHVPTITKNLVSTTLLIKNRDISDINATKRMLESKFDIKDLGVTDVILGIRIHKTPQRLALSQFHYIEKALDKFKYLDFDFSKISLDVSFALQKNEVTLASLSVQDWSCPVCPLASKSSPKQRKALAVTAAYLIYDFVCCLFDKQVKIDNLIHHLVCIVGIGAGLAYKLCGSEMVAALWITEISSPFLHLRELLKELGYRDTDLNFAADVLFAIIFTIARMIGGPYLSYVTLSADNPIIIKAMALGLQLVSVFWFYKIARMVMYKLSRRSKSTTVLAKK